MKAGREAVPIVIVPIAFVSEHSETLVELDIEYKELAEDYRVPGYYRVPTLNTHNGYISSLRSLVLNVLAKDAGTYSNKFKPEADT